MNNLQTGVRSVLLLPLLACGERLVGWPIADQTAPIVLWTTPDGGADEVAVNATVLATFSESMDPDTLTADAMTLRGRSGRVNGVVSRIGTEAILFTPNGRLDHDAEYAATITTAVTDLAGNPLKQDHHWSFTTDSLSWETGETDTGEPDWDLEPVDLGTLRRFVAVAGAGLTSSNASGVTSLSGNVGLSPTGTCLGDGVPCTASNPVINGNLYADDAEGVAAQAKEDLSDALEDAMSRPPGTTVDDISGMTLPPGVYTSSTSLSIAVGEVVTLDGEGDENAVWIFQIGSSLTVNNGARIVLKDGARAENVYWAVSTSSTLGVEVVFQGTVLAAASNSVGTGTVVVGRLLCTEGTITLLSNTITLPTL